MNTLAATIALALALTGGRVESGHMSAYDKNPTKFTLKARLDFEQLTRQQLLRADVFLAVPDCNRIGDEVLVRINGGPWQRGLIFDCAVRDDSDGARSWMAENNIVAEVDWFTWQEVGGGTGHTIEVMYE